MIPELEKRVYHYLKSITNDELLDARFAEYVACTFNIDSQLNFWL
jgi:hypothetical protein